MTALSTYERTVTTQDELDQAIADGVSYVEIRSDKGVWLEVYSNKDSNVTARGNSNVTARGNSNVTAWGNSNVTAWENSNVTAWGNSNVTARENSNVTASPHVSVHLHSARAKITGGVVIDVTAIDLTDPQTWCDEYGVTVVDGIATVYKAVNDAWSTDRGFDYSPGATPEALDWTPDNECGGGLHFGPTPTHAKDYHPEATKYVAVGVELATLRPILSGTAKCKAPKVVRPCVEVDERAREVAVAVA